jgi:hypothetical protein
MIARLLAGFLRGYAVVSAYTLALLIAVGLILLGSGTVTVERLREAARVLKKGTPPPAPRIPPKLQAEWAELEAARHRQEATLDNRKQELRKLDDMTSGRLAQIERERGDLDKLRRETQDSLGKLEKERLALAQAKADAEVEANLPVFAKLEGTSLLALIRGYDDPRIVRYLRALKPAKAAEVLEAMRTDPQFEKDFRQLPADAPSGAKTRAEQIMEELKKAP